MSKKWAPSLPYYSSTTVFLKIRMIEASRRLEVVQRKAVSAANKTGQVNEREIF
ncbi:hypothetical protein [Pseudomonas kitaguniensis]|uniref:hypothetical protein n=1 Tax=Pseudomonas kitaguniensis TaxID=2607908 RepID=UPI000AC5393E|nr:hypothetical protein [Pseudomonas kitaguniensis]